MKEKFEHKKKLYLQKNKLYTHNRHWSSGASYLVSGRNSEATVRWIQNIDVMPERAPSEEELIPCQYIQLIK